MVFETATHDSLKLQHRAYTHMYDSFKLQHNYDSFKVGLYYTWVIKAHTMTFTQLYLLLRDISF